MANVAAPRPLLALLSLASLLSPFGMIVVVPTLAEVASYYHVGHGQAQYLIASYLFGLGVGQPMAGALSDRIGRRPVMLAGFSLFTLASLGCMLSQDFVVLILMRVLQALGVSVGTVGSRAIVRDTHDALGAVQALAWIGAAMGVAPVLGPAIGGLLGAWAGPPAVFAASAVLGFGVTMALGTRLEETRVPSALTAPAGTGWTGNYRALLASRVFMGYTLMYAFTQGCFFAFLAVGAIVFQEHLGLDQRAFGIVWGTMGTLYIGGAALGGRLATGAGLMPVLRWTTLASAGGGSALALATSVFGVTLPGLLLPLAVMMLAAGVQAPLAAAGTVNHRPDIAGTASGLSGSLALVVSGSFSIISGEVYVGSFSPVAWLIAASAAATTAAWWMARSATAA
ncbi:MAG: MFS transporter [Gammaproteobacteria bacterium]|nr:MFS transporter [Gammaproteobacteria bacterium]